MLIAFCLRLFVLWVPLFEERKHIVAVLMADIHVLVYEFCKFEMYIFEIAQVIGDNAHIAFFMY